MNKYYPYDPERQQTDKWIVLNGDFRTLIMAPSLMAWADWYEHGQRVCKRTEVRGAHVSTVFLSIDHGMYYMKEENYRPVLFETMIFGGPADEYQQRYHNYDDAMKGHAEVVKRLKNYMRKTKSQKNDARRINKSQRRKGLRPRIGVRRLVSV